MGGLINFRVVLAAKRLRALDLAKELRESPSKVSLIMNGYVEPDPDFRKRCSAALGVSERWLFSRRYRRLPVADNHVEAVAVAG
jgi:transcriptional regulator with XRE-family HTH domain